MRKRLITDNDNDSEDDKPDRYLITYADLITLLLGLFVILYASAQVDESKYKEMSKAFSNVFRSVDGGGKGQGILPGNKEGAPVDVLPGSRTKSMQEMENRAENALDKFVRLEGLKIQNSGENLVITLPELLLFSSAKAEINPQGNELLDSLAALLKNADMLISVDGHTDSAPIKSFRYASNWHLSTARALSVGYSLTQRGLPEQNLIIRGYGSQRPIADNSTEEGKSKNRRVEITLSKLPTDVPTSDGYEKINN